MSQDLGKFLLAKTDIIIESWIAAIRKDAEVESSKDLAYKSVRNSIPLVMEALATILSQSINDRHQKLEDNGWEHGVVRAEQGYDVAEIVREYGLLRTIIFDVLTPELIANSGTEIMETVKTIDSTLDRVITLSLKSYLANRLKELEHLLKT